MGISTIGLLWIVSFIAIWYVFIKENDAHENYGLLGAIALEANAFLGFAVIGDNLITWVIIGITTMYFIRIMMTYEVFTSGT